MSYLFNALKQSEQTTAPEQAHLSYQHEKQLRFYRRLSFGLAGVILFTGTLAAGYSVGKLVQGTGTESEQGISNVILAAEPTVSEAVGSEPTQVEAKTSASPEPVEKDIGTYTAQQPTLAQSSLQIQPSVHYQWASVHIGVDINGQAVYEQRLVPVTNQLSGPIHGGPVTGVQNVVTQTASNERQSTKNSTQELDLSQYRVLGKPLEPTSTYHDPELDQVSDELKDAFAQAVAETEGNSNNEVIATTPDSARATPIELLPQGLQNSIPRLRYQAHIYATEADKRWIKLNNRELYEGDSIGALTLLEITPEQALFDFDGYEFTLKAMQDWLL